MTDRFVPEPSKLEGFLIYVAIGLVVLLGIGLAQPVWRGKEMVVEFISDCDKRGGVLLEHKKLFGTTYECASRLN